MRIIDAFFSFLCVPLCRLSLIRAHHGCHGALEVSVGGTVVTAVRNPRDHATNRVMPHSVALGQQRALTVQVQMSTNIVIGVLPVGTTTLTMMAC